MGEAIQKIQTDFADCDKAVKNESIFVLKNNNKKNPNPGWEEHYPERKA